MQSTTRCSLLNLLESVNTLTTDDREVAATVAYLVNSGRVRFTGSLAGAKISPASALPHFPKKLWPSLLGLPASCAQNL